MSSPQPEGRKSSSSSQNRQAQFGVALELRDLRICAYAFLVGAAGGMIAQDLLELIYLFTNVFFFGRFSFVSTNPSLSRIGAWVVLIPSIGGLVVGLLIYFLEPTLKGHGIPEAMESVLYHRSHMRTRVVILKPLATALAIGTGGPFGAEGPIIQTGAALGSLLGKWLGMSPYQRRVLLASGAAAGMAATFTAPFAGILVAIELLLFEFRARSFIPVSIAAVVATAVRVELAGWAPLFPMPIYKITGVRELWLFAILGVLAGVIGVLMIRALSMVEEFFDNAKIRYEAIWGPVVGAIALGCIGYFVPEILGTSYGTIRDILNDRLGAGRLSEIAVAKFGALVISLGSGTTGGIFAPSLVVGGGFGAVYGEACEHLFPHVVSNPAFYALAAMAGVFGGVARAPFTSIVFLTELSRNPNALMPLILCVMVADGIVRLFSRESIMTVKLAKRGLIVSQDYRVPTLMRVSIGDVMRKSFRQVEESRGVGQFVGNLSPEDLKLTLVVNSDGFQTGILDGTNLMGIDPATQQGVLKEFARQDYVTALRSESVDAVHRRMLLQGVEIVVVVDSLEAPRPVGVACSADILQARRWLLEEDGLAASGQSQVA